MSRKLLLLLPLVPQSDPVPTTLGTMVNHDGDGTGWALIPRGRSSHRVQCLQVWWRLVTAVEFQVFFCAYLGTLQLVQASMSCHGG